MRRVACGFLVGSLVLGGLAVAAEAGGWHRRHHGRHHFRPRFHHGRHHGHFAGGFLAGATTVLILDALYTPRVVYTPPVVYRPIPYRAPVCQDIWIPGRWELRSRQQGDFTTHYHVWVEDHWQRQCP